MYITSTFRGGGGGAAREGMRRKRETVFAIFCSFISHVTFPFCSHLMLCVDLQFKDEPSI